MDIFDTNNISLDIDVSSLNSGIELAGSLLNENGYVSKEYIEAMKKREEVISTYVGNSVAVPHGISGSENLINKSGISFVRTTKPVIWDEENEVRLIIGIAGKDGTHMDILGKIAIVCSDEDNIEKLILAQSAEDVVKIFEEFEE
ncbi:PTS sugar transporter subunit IIA [Vibrio quintilis]|uniref:PTS sugar transporter subunit IIA n=1 Tax=Vibrio quintilis TaxID=1117707 RepID=UPI0021CA9508|nr:PTS sugar transporter subunit IIA [Vibrio quintilis]